MQVDFNGPRELSRLVIAVVFCNRNFYVMRCGNSASTSSRLVWFVIFSGTYSLSLANCNFINYKAVVLAEGELAVGDEGVPQGSLCSPILANIFAHSMIDV